jgi:formate dehydrogenase major subunit
MKLTRVNGNGARMPSPALLEGLNPSIDRRSFLKAAGIGGAGLAAALAPSMARDVEAQQAPGAQGPKVEHFKTICTKCAVGCGLIGAVQNGVWVRQEPWFEHPINQGSLCSKGAAARASIISEKRLRYPMKLAGGKWQRLSWDQALSEVSAKMLDIRKKHGPDALHVNFSAHQSNENGFAIRKWAAMWGTNNADFQARI